LDISFCCWFRGVRVPSHEVPSVSIRDTEAPGDCGSGVLTTEEVYGIGDKGSGGTTAVDVQKLLEVFFQTWDYFPEPWKHQDFWSISICVQGLLLYINYYNVFKNFNIQVHILNKISEPIHY
jgi:hypothetical protein